MKKFYAFAAAALCALAANAQNGEPLYATGADFDPAWNPEEAVEFEFKDGKYVLEKENLSDFKISTVKGGWDDFNGGCLTCNYGKEPGVAVELTPGDGNISAPIAGANYTITVAGDLSTITLSTDAEKPTTATVLYIKGDMNSWGNDDAWKLVPYEDVPDNIYYSFKCAEGQAIAVGEAFKVATASWASPNIGGGEDPQLLLDTDNEVFDGSQANLTCEAEFTGSLYLTLDLEGSIYLYLSNENEAPDWWPTSAVSSIAADSNAPVKYFNLQGVQVANPENGLYIVVKGNKASKVIVK